MKIVHYINQFFAGIGGEEKASVGIEVRQGPVGPGTLLSRAFPDATIVTVICGDNYASEHPEEVLEAVAGVVEENGADLVVAGPAFNAGRYGLVCGELASKIPKQTDAVAITGLYEENAATSMFRNDAHIVRTGKSAAGMQEAMARIVEIAPKLVSGEEIEDKDAAGLYTSMARRSRVADRAASDRAVDLLLESFETEDVGTELAVPDFEPVAPPAPVGLLGDTKVALVTEGGLVPKGNPDGLTVGWSERWSSYDVDRLLEEPSAFEAIHGGYDTRFVNEDPFRLVPADVVSQLVDEGVVGELHDKYYVTAGMATPVQNARKMGAEIAAALLNEGVQAVIFTST